MALAYLGLALGAYGGARLSEGLAGNRRRVRRLRAGDRCRSPAQTGLDSDALTLRRRRGDLVAGRWAIALSVGSYAAPVLAPAALAVTIYSMLPMLRATERELTEEQRFGDDLINAGVALGSLGLGQPLAAAVQAWVFHAADVAVLASRERARRLFVQRLPTPRPARVLRDGEATEVDVDTLGQGDVLLLAMGEAVPVDGRILAGSISVDQQRLTGESVPRDLGIADPVYAGTLVLRGEARVEVTVAGRETTLARVEQLLRSGADGQTNLRLRAESAADAVAPPLIAAAAAAWPLIGPSAALAILFSAPVNSMRATGALAVTNHLTALLEDGVLIKDGRALEALATVDTVLLDKTGTVTADELRVSQVTAVGAWERSRVLAVAAAAEGRVTHPLAQALAVAAAADPDRPTVHATRFDFRVGFGVTAHIDGERVLVGGRRHLDAAGITIDDRTLASLSESEALGATTLLVATGSGVQGVIALATRPRPEAIGILRFISEHGIERIAMVSGDDDAPSHAVARQLGIEEVHANVLPEGKAELVRRLQREGRRVCFVGDGANDALAMSQADCAISMHGGAELAADAAGILLLEGDLRRLPHLLASARTQQRQLFGLLAYWGGYGVTNIGLNLALRLGVLQSSLVFGTAFGIGLLQTGVPRRRANGDDDAQPNRPAGQPHSSEEPQRDKSRQPPSSRRNPVLP